MGDHGDGERGVEQIAEINRKRCDFNSAETAFRRADEAAAGAVVGKVNSPEGRPPSRTGKVDHTNPYVSCITTTADLVGKD